MNLIITFEIFSSPIYFTLSCYTFRDQLLILRSSLWSHGRPGGGGEGRQGGFCPLPIVFLFKDKWHIFHCFWANSIFLPPPPGKFWPPLEKKSDEVITLGDFYLLTKLQRKKCKTSKQLYKHLEQFRMFNLKRWKRLDHNVKRNILSEKRSSLPKYLLNRRLSKSIKREECIGCNL